MTPNYIQVASLPLTDNQIRTNKEGIAVIDVNSDGRKDIIITNAGEPYLPISPLDPPITILFGQQNGTFIPADTSALAPTGWVNDYVFIDSNENGYPEIVAIDHGREIAYEAKYWSKLPVYEFDPQKNKFIEYTSLTQGNSVGFYHNSTNTADVNKDGLNDFIVATMSHPSIRIYLGDKTTIFKESTSSLLGNRYEIITEWNSSRYIGPGAAGVIDIGGDSDFDFFLLPYTDQFTKNQEYGQLFLFENGLFTTDQFFNTRESENLTLPETWGYSFARVDDINGDGLQDILAFAENPSNNAGGTAIFVSMIQKSNGSFEISPSFTAEPLITNRRGDLFVNNLWHDYKFSLEDLDGDNDLDLFWGQWFGGYQSFFKDGIFINDGTGHFFRDTSTGNEIASQITWSGNSGARTYMSDLDFDGIGDFLVFDNNWLSGQGITTIRAFYSGSVSNSSYLHFGGLRKYYDIEVVSGSIKVVDKLMTDGVAYMRSDGRVEFQDIAIAFDLYSDAGTAAKILGAVFGKASVANRDYVGIGLDLLDKGMSYDTLAGLALNAAKATTNDQIVTTLWTNVVGSAPSTAEKDPFIKMLEDGMAPGTLARIAADTSLNTTNINLVGLAQTGIEYTPVV